MDNKFKGVIFDLDGTLINSIPDIADSMNRVLSSHGLPEYPYEQFNYFVGNGIKQLVERSIPEQYRNGEKFEALFNAMMEEYGNNYLNKTYIYDGIPQLLNFLKNKGIKISILSNKADSITRKICSELFREQDFTVILGATDNFPRKPSPDAALHIASVMDILPENIFYLGDTNTDMQTAIAAGFFPAGAEWGFRTKEELANAGAKFIASQPLDCTIYFK